MALIVKQPDLGTAMLVLAAGMSVIFFAGLSWKLILPPVRAGADRRRAGRDLRAAACAPTGVRWPVLHDYQQQRICTLLDPSRDPLGKGFHIIQGMIAIGSGGVLGKGFMQGTQTHLEFIPERTTDFIFAAFSEEFGLIGNLLLIGAFLFLVLRGLNIALEAPTLFARLLAGSITLIFFTYAFVNMGMVSGILPVVGVPLPFISYGGTAMVTLGTGAGHADVDCQVQAAGPVLTSRPGFTRWRWWAWAIWGAPWRRACWRRGWPVHVHDIDAAQACRAGARPGLTAIPVLPGLHSPCEAVIVCVVDASAVRGRCCSAPQGLAGAMQPGPVW